MSSLHPFNLAVTAALMTSVASTDAAVFRLRGEHRATTNIVRLGDVAQIESADPDEARRLGAIELFPAPIAGRTLEVTLRHIQDAMARRNENPLAHAFSGVSRVVVSGPSPTRTRPAVFLTTSQTKRAVERVRQAANEYLATHAAEGHWDVEFELSAVQADAVRKNLNAVSVTGASELPDGRVRFDVTLDANSEPAGFVVDADVSLAPAIVVAARPIPRGTKVRAMDVELRHAPPPRGEKATFATIEEVVGMQVTRAIRASQVLDDRSIRPELMVRRRDVVTVYSRAGGVTVRTMARSVDDGSHGELIAVESLTNRKSFFARVSGPQEVEVVAQPIRAVAKPNRPADSLTVQAQGNRR